MLGPSDERPRRKASVMRQWDLASGEWRLIDRRHGELRIVALPMITLDPLSVRFVAKLANMERERGFKDQPNHIARATPITGWLSVVVDLLKPSYTFGPPAPPARRVGFALHDDYWDDDCSTCGLPGDILLCCDTCEKVYHMGCLPDRAEIVGEFQCKSCLAATELARPLKGSLADVLSLMTVCRNTCLAASVAKASCCAAKKKMLTERAKRVAAFMSL